MFGDCDFCFPAHYADTVLFRRFNMFKVLDRSTYQVQGYSWATGTMRARRVSLAHVNKGRRIFFTFWFWHSPSASHSQYIAHTIEIQAMVDLTLFSHVR